MLRKEQTLKLSDFKPSIPKNTFPSMLLIIGGPKVGKSSFCASIPNALIADLEGVGYDHIEAKAVAKPVNRAELKEVIKLFFESDFDFLVVDHLKMVTQLYCEAISSTAGVKLIEQIGFGKGQAELRHDIFRLFSYIREGIQKTGKRIIFVAHSTDRNGEVRLDVDGKIDTMLTGMVDAIGHIYRQGPINKVNFKSQAGAEFGCRNKALASYNDVADFAKIKEVSEK